MLFDRSHLQILLVEDDPEDQMLVRDACHAAQLDATLHVVGDGEELLDYLYRRAPFTDAIRPDLILLDLNLPRRDGREALRHIKADHALFTIPVIVLTGSDAPADVAEAYNLGATSYIRKPGNFPLLVRAMRALGDYWGTVVALPPRTAHPARIALQSERQLAFDVEALISGRSPG